MSEVYAFGTFFCTHPLPRNKTANRIQAKFRSQAAVRDDLGLQITGPENSLYELTNVEGSPEESFSVAIVYISDLDYQLRNTDPVDDEWRIRHDRAASADSPANVAGVNASPPSNADLTADNPNPDPFANIAPQPKPVVLPPIPFASIRLELGYDYGAVGGPSFATTTVKVADERESIQGDRVLPLHRFQLGDRMVADSERDLLQEVSYLKQFHQGRKGSYEGFRYKDWADYQATDQYIATGDGVKTHFQLRKAYRVGNAVTYRPIQKPVFGTVDLFVDGVNVAVDLNHEWTVEHDTGIVWHPEPLPAGAVLTANFEFDVPVRFESDAIGFSLQGYEDETGDTRPGGRRLSEGKSRCSSIYRLESVFVTEIRIPLLLPWDLQPPGEINEPLDLGIIYDTVEQYSFATERQDLQSGWGSAKTNRDESKLVFNLGDRNFDRQELDRLLDYFYCSGGKSRQFSITTVGNSYRARLESDSLNIKFQANNEHDALYNISGLKLIAGDDGLFSFIDRDTYLYFLLDTSGSMDNEIPVITQAINQLKEILSDRVYGSYEAMSAKVSLQNFSDERYLNSLVQNYQEKAVYFIWINEADPIYHSTNSHAPPTEAYRSDLANFLESYGDRLKFRAAIYSIVFNSQAFDTWQAHLTAAHQGTDGYDPALKNYNIGLFLNVAPETTAAEYYQNFITGSFS